MAIDADGGWGVQVSHSRFRGRWSRRWIRVSAASFISLWAALLPAGAQRPVASPSSDLTELGLEALMQLQVTSVDRKAERVSRTPAAIYVITQNEIRRSTATSIPELLRGIPGVEVARIDSDHYAITARAFNGRYSNMLLVMVDGRSIYNPIFSGVYWETLDMPLEDIERIEVIRGPGGTLWGTNAVNGIINIITKHSRKTQGGLVTLSAGTEDRGLGLVRYGGKLGKASTYRVYGKYFNRRPIFDSGVPGSLSGWDSGHAGFRLDWDQSDKDAMTLEGEGFFGGDHHHPSDPSLGPGTGLQGRTTFAGGDFLARWTRTYRGGSETTLQGYYAHESRDELLKFGIHTLDMDFQHHFQPLRRNDVVWGVGFRYASYTSSALGGLALDPGNRRMRIFSAFAQDEFTLVPDRLELTVGSKFEKNPFTGLEVQPGARLLWTPSSRHSIWGAVTRALRTPSPFNSDVYADFSATPGPGGLLYIGRVLGNRLFRSERVTAYELGYHAGVSKSLFVDIAGFHNAYKDILTMRREDPFLEAQPSPPHIVIPNRFGNEARGQARGVEVAATWKIANWWQVSPAYSLARIQLEVPPDPAVSLSLRTPRSSPGHQASLRSYINLPRRLEFDAAVFQVGRVGRLGGDASDLLEVPSYMRVDARLGWRFGEHSEVSLAVQNLLNHRHLEFLSAEFVESALVGRSVFGKLTWHF